MITPLCHIPLLPQWELHLKHQISLENSLTQHRFFEECFSCENGEDFVSLFVKGIFLNVHSNNNIDLFIHYCVILILKFTYLG